MNRCFDIFIDTSSFAHSCFHIEAYLVAWKKWNFRILHAQFLTCQHKYKFVFIGTIVTETRCTSTNLNHDGESILMLFSLFWLILGKKKLNFHFFCTCICTSRVTMTTMSFSISLRILFVVCGSFFFSFGSSSFIYMHSFQIWEHAHGFIHYFLSGICVWIGNRCINLSIEHTLLQFFTRKCNRKVGWHRCTALWCIWQHPF